MEILCEKEKGKKTEVYTESSANDIQVYKNQVRAWQMIGTCIHLNIYFVNIIYYLIKH